MDPRLAALASIRKTKMDVAHRDFVRAYQAFAVAFRRCENLMQRRQTFVQQAAETIRAEMAAMMAGTASVAGIQAVYEATTRRDATLVTLDLQVEQATRERERLREIALAKQRTYATARKAVEKLGILTEKLRHEENSLQIRLSESYADSASRDAVTGQWKLQQMD